MDTAQESQDAVVELPDWISAGNSTNDLQLPGFLSIRHREIRRTRKELEEAVFEGVFERVLDAIYAGSTMSAAVRDQERDIDPGAFLRWIKRDGDRERRYKEAKEIRTEAWAGKIIEHAVASDAIEDVQRSKLIVDTYKWLMAADNRRTYGETKTIDVGGTISVKDALRDASARAALVARVIEDEVIDIAAAPAAPSTSKEVEDE